MAELVRQGSRFREIDDYLREVIELPAAIAAQYAESLVAEGYDTVALVDDLSSDELKADFGFKTGHAKRVEKSQRQRGVGRFAPQAGGALRLAEPEPELSPRPEEAAPAGNKLADGSTVTILDGEENFLGRGASGIVRRGIMAPGGGGAAQDVACKMLAPGATEREHQNFFKEYEIAMQAAAQCNRAARTHGCFRHDGSLCLVMKMYARSLLDVLQPPKDAPAGAARVPLAVRVALEYGMQIAAGLAQLHAVHIKVGDLKPGNLLLDEANSLVIADFGISAVASSSIVSTKSAATGGTPAYMSPEQLDTDLGDATSQVDIWAWGCIMYEMLAGHTPWHGKNPHQIMADVIVKRKRLEVPADAKLPPEVRALIEGCFEFSAAERPSAAHIADVLTAALTLGAASLSAQQPGSPTYDLAHTLLHNTWVKKEEHVLHDVVQVHEVSNPRLRARYDEYKASISPPRQPDGVANGNELQVFHGCTAVAMDVDNPDSIVQTGFLKKYWKTSAGDWQRFGPGFYFGQQASKSHDYPLPEMRALAYGTHKRCMLLCKVARGKAYRTQENIDTLKGQAPEGFDSVHGDAREAGDLNYDEIVVYEEAAVLPFAIVEYTFTKIDPLAAGGNSTAGLRGSLGLSASAGLLTTGTGASAGVPASSTTAGEGAEVGVVRRLSRVAVAGMVLQDKQQQLGADIAAEMALHGIEVHVWQPPELACLSCSPKRCTCAGCPPTSPGEFSKRKVSEALARAEAWMLSGPQRGTDAQAQEAWGTDQSEPEPEEVGKPSTSGLVAEPRFLAAESLVTGHDSPAELVHGCDLIIENLADLLEVKREFFGSITSTVEEGTFMTSTTSTAKFNLDDITQGAATTATCGTVHGVRFLLGKAGSSAWTTVGTRAVEITSAQAAMGDSGQDKGELQELAVLLACAGKVAVFPRRNKKKRGFDVLCKSKLPLSHGGVKVAGRLQWRPDACVLCAGTALAGHHASQLFVCRSCTRDHSADVVVCSDDVAQTMLAHHGGGGGDGGGERPRASLGSIDKEQPA